MNMNEYTRKFYEWQQARSRSSAKSIIPLVIKLIQPRSVIDVGCGTGTWLSVFEEIGIHDVFGLDGEWVKKDMLLIPSERFVKVDLQKPIRIDRKFDLVMSMEVAEHLPAESAIAFVEFLTNLGSVILFSSAVPGQGGAHHINEQWPAYWVTLFRDRGFRVIDCIRKHVWQDETVEWWYAQNALLFVRHDHITRYPLLQRELDDDVLLQINLIHPKLYLSAREPSNMTLRRVLSAIPTIVVKGLINMLRTIFRRSQRFRK